MQLYGPKANNDPESDLVIFEQFLRDPETSIPLNSNFLISFAAASMPLGIQTFNEAATGDYEPKPWGLDIEKKKLIRKAESNKSIRNQIQESHKIELHQQESTKEKIGLNMDYFLNKQSLK